MKGIEMPVPIELKFKKASSPFFYVSPLIAFLGRSRTFDGIDTIPEISAQLSDAVIQKNHLARFNRVCGIQPADRISPIYPITLVFSFFQRMLSLKQAPLSLFRVLSNRLQINQIQALKENRSYDIHCKTSDARITEKGLELDMEARIFSGGHVVWSAIETFFYRGRFGQKTSGRKKEGLSPVRAPQTAGSWFLKDGVGFEFAKISGDGNGLHYSKQYARLFGFERDFAQPFLIVSRALEHLGSQYTSALRESETFCLDVLFKGQCYYNHEITIRNEKSDWQRFDIYCQGNDRPCMSAKLDV